MVKTARSSTALSPQPSPNLLLAALPPNDFARVAAALEPVPVEMGNLLHMPDADVDRVYFPGDGYCSMLTVLREGQMVEVATIGREGAVGATSLMESVRTPTATMVQSEIRSCFSMQASAYREEMDRRGAFHMLLTRYIQALIAIVMQSTACNAVHSIEQRLARWILTVGDRMESPAFPLTQEFAAMMLGASRPTVNIVAGVLERKGLIEHQRGHVGIIDRQGLRSAACECYAVTTSLLETVTAVNAGQRMRH